MLNPLFLHTPRRFWDGPCAAPLPEHPGVQGEVKPPLILPTIAKRGVCVFFSPPFFLISAVFQVFSPQHRGTSTRGGSWASSGRQWLLGRPPSRSIPRCSLCSSPGKLRPAGPSQFRANHVGNAALPFSGSFSPACRFPFLVRGGRWGGLEATSTTTELRLGSGAPRPDRTPLVSPAQTLPWSAVPRFKANPDGKGAAGGGKTPSAANRGRRKPSSLTPSWSHPRFYSYPPAFFFFLFSANPLNTQVTSSARSPFDTLMHVYIFI